MAFSMASLLLHEVAVPAQARAAVKEALYAPEAEREALLRSAARILWQETGLACADVRELLDLDSSLDASGECEKREASSSEVRITSSAA